MDLDYFASLLFNRTYLKPREGKWSPTLKVEGGEDFFKVEGGEDIIAEIGGAGRTVR
jgi:hypothetical protein